MGAGLVIVDTSDTVADTKVLAEDGADTANTTGVGVAIPVAHFF